MDALLHKQLIFHGSWLVFPMMALLYWRMRRAGIGRPLYVLTLVGCVVLAWARFVEPQWIQIRHTDLAGTGAEARIALVSDIHLGVYKDERFLQRVVDHLNTLPVDAVLIAGDLTYEPQGQSLQTLFAPLAQLRPPVYAVLGNHDQQRPGPDIDVELRHVLSGLGVSIIEGQVNEALPGLQLAGLGDRWAGKDDSGFLTASSIPPVVLAHNPDSAMDLRPEQASLVLAGHTHGGQIRIPWLYRKVIPSRHGFDRDEQTAHTPSGPVRVFTTSGLGEVGLPLRLFNPPVIDILHLQP